MHWGRCESNCCPRGCLLSEWNTCLNNTVIILSLIIRMISILVILMDDDDDFDESMPGHVKVNSRLQKPTWVDWNQIVNRHHLHHHHHHLHQHSNQHHLNPPHHHHRLPNTYLHHHYGHDDDDHHIATSSIKEGLLSVGLLGFSSHASTTSSLKL